MKSKLQQISQKRKIESLMVLSIILFFVVRLVMGGLHIGSLLGLETKNLGGLRESLKLLEKGNPYKYGGALQPMGYLILKMISCIPGSLTVHTMVYMLSVGVMAFLCGTVKEGSKKEKILFSSIVFGSIPAITLYQSGSTFVFSAIFVVIFYKLVNSINKKTREIAYFSLAMAVSIHGFALLFALILIKEKRIKEFMRTCCYSVVLGISPIFCFGGLSMLLHMFSNMTGVLKEYLIGNFKTRLDFMGTISGFSQMAGIYFSWLYTVTKILLIILLFAGIIAFFYVKEDWKKWAIIGNMLVSIPVFSDRSPLIFMALAFILFWNQSEEDFLREKNQLYAGLFFIMCIPIPFIGSTGRCYIQGLAVLLMLLLLIGDGFKECDFIYSRYQRFIEKWKKTVFVRRDTRVAKVCENDKIWFWIGLVGTVVVCGTYVFLVFDKTMPVAEGWYTVFSQYINNGKQPYFDYEFLYTPFYSYLMAFFSNIFGYKIITLRILGAVLYIGIAIAAYMIFTRIFSPMISAVAATTLMLYLQSEVVQVFYDYIRFMDLFVYIATALLLGYLGRLYSGKEKHSKASLIIAGFFSGLAIMTKQNSGMLFTVYWICVLVFLIFMEKDTKQRARDFAYYAISAVIPIAITMICMARNGSLQLFLQKTTSDAMAAKGGIASVLFRWIIETIPAWLNVSGGIILTIAFLVLGYYLSKKHYEPCGKKGEVFLGIVFLGIVLWQVVAGYHNMEVATRYYKPDSTASMYISYAVCVLIFGLTFLRLCILKKRKADISGSDVQMTALTGVVFALGYGVGTSGGLAESQIALGIGVLLAIALTYTSYRCGFIMKTVVIALAINLSLTAVVKKYVVPYTWWGLTETDIWSNTEEIEGIPLLEGIKVSANSKYVYESICRIVEESTSAEEHIFAFPHIPIFYALTDRYPSTYTLVQWFDVSADKNIREDIDTLKEEPPKVIILAHIPQMAVEGHERAFRDGKKSATREMEEFLMDYVVSNNYEQAGDYALDSNWTISVYVAR